MKCIKKIIESINKLLEIDIVRVIFFSIVTVLFMVAFVHKITS